MFRACRRTAERMAEFLGSDEEFQYAATELVRE